MAPAQSSSPLPLMAKATVPVMLPQPFLHQPHLPETAPGTETSDGNLYSHDPPNPLDDPNTVISIEPLLYLPVVILGYTYGALLDSGCSDNFINTETASKLRLTTYPLKVAMPFQQVDGSIITISTYVRPNVYIGPVKLRLILKVAPGPTPVLFGYPFLRFLKIRPDWTTRLVSLSYQGQTHLIQGIQVPVEPQTVIRRRGNHLIQVLLPPSTHSLPSLIPNPTIQPSPFQQQHPPTPPPPSAPCPYPTPSPASPCSNGQVHHKQQPHPQLSTAYISGCT